MSSTLPFSQLLARRRRQGASVQFDVTEDWQQGRTAYGGLVSAMGAQAMRDEAAAQVTPEVLAVLLADAPATPAVAELTQRVPSSSVTWALELRPLPPATAEGWWRIDSESVQVEGGYVNHASQLWAPGGVAAATGTQLVTVFG